MASLRLIYFHGTLMEAAPSDFVLSFNPIGPTVRIGGSDGVQDTFAILDREEWIKLVRTSSKPSLSSWQSPYGPLRSLGRPSLIEVAKLIRDTSAFQAFLSLVTIGDYVFSRAPSDPIQFATEYEPNFHLFISSLSSRNEMLRRNDTGVLFLSQTFATTYEESLTDLMANGYLMHLHAETNQGSVHEVYIVPFRIPIKPLFKLSNKSESALLKLREIRNQALGEV